MCSSGIAFQMAKSVLALRLSAIISERCGALGEPIVCAEWTTLCRDLVRREGY